LYRGETKVIKLTLSSKSISKFKERDEILYFHGRLTPENPFRFANLDNIPILDVHEFSGPLPVVLGSSPLLYALILDIHCQRSPHAGIEVFKEVMIPDGLRRLVKRIKKDCIECKLLARKVIELEMSPHPASRTLPFSTL